MKKIIPVICISAAFTMVSSCKNFMEGAALRDEIKSISNKTVVTVLVQNESSAAGYFSNAGEKQCTVGDSLELEFTVNADYTFNEFFAVDKETGDDLYDCVEFTPVEERQKGTFKIYKYNAKILKASENLWIQALCSWALDDDRPEFTEVKGFKIRAAKSERDMEEENYIEINRDYSLGDRENLALSSDREQINKCRTNEVYVKINGMDISNPLTAVRVTETLIFTNTLAVSGKSGTFDEKVFFKTSSRNVYSGDFIYRYHNKSGGYYRLDFQVIDAVGNVSDEKISFFVIKDTECNTKNLTPSLVLKPVSASDYSSESKFATYRTDKDIIPFTLTNAEKDYWFGSAAPELYGELKTKALISYDDKNYEEVPYGTMIYKGEETENCIDISGYDRYRGFYIKFRIEDDSGNILDTRSTFLCCPCKPVFYTFSSGSASSSIKFAYAAGPVSPSSTASKYFYCLPKDGSQYMYKALSVDASAQTVSFTIDPQKEYDYVMVSTPSTATYKTLISDIYTITPDQYISSAPVVKNTPQIEYETFSDGLNSGTYTLKGKITNYNEIFCLSSDENAAFAPLHTRILKDSVCLAIISGNEFEFSLPYQSGSLALTFRCESWNSRYAQQGISVIFGPENTAPKINNLNFGSSYSAERNRYRIYVTETNLKTDSVKMYIDDSLEDLSEEEIMNLPVHEWESTLKSGSYYYCYFNKRGLEEKIYNAYVYAEDNYGNYAFKKIILNNITLDSKMAVSGTGALETSQYQPVNPSDVSGYDKYFCTYDGSSSLWKWASASHYGAEPYFKKVCLSETSDINVDTGYIAVPFVWYAQGVNPVHKKLICSGSQLTLCFDSPVLYEVVYCKENLGNNADRWVKTENTLTSLRTYGGCSSYYYKDSYSGTVLVEQINPQVQGTMEFKNIEIDTQYIPDSTYYTVLVYFADGTKTMSDVLFKY